MNATVECFFEKSYPTRAVLVVDPPFPLAVAVASTFGASLLLCTIGTILVKAPAYLHQITRRELADDAPI